MYNYLITIDTDDENLKVYKFENSEGNIFGVIMPVGTDIESAKNQLIEYLNNPIESPLDLS